MHKINEVPGISFFNKETKEEVLKMDGLNNSFVCSEITHSTEPPETRFSIDDNLNININNSAYISSGELEYIHPDFKDVLLKDRTFKIMMDGYRDILVQKRTHKKNRINKKWIKRYGYKTKKEKVELVFDKCKFTSDGEFEVYLDYERGEN